MTEDWCLQEDSIPIRQDQLAFTWPKLLSQSEHQLIYDYLLDRFGIPKHISSCFLFFRQGKSIYIIKGSQHIKKVSTLKIHRLGMKGFTLKGGRLRPSTRLLMAFERFITKNIVTLTKEELIKLKHHPMDIKNPLEDGIVVIKVKGLGTVGVGYIYNKKLYHQGSRI